MKTLLHIIDTTGPGGAETVFIDLISNLPEQLYRSIVVIHGKGWVYDELNRRGIEPVILEAKGSFNWRYLKNLLSLIRREKVAIIQSHLLGSNVYSALAGLLSRTPVVAVFHGAVDVSEQERLSSLKFSAINAGAAVIVAVSKDLRDNIVERTALSSKKTRVIYNGINTAQFKRPKKTDLRQQFSWPEDDVIVGSLGNIRPAKAYDELLKAAALTIRLKKNVRFVIAGQGKGKLYESLLELRSELKLDEHVFFLGFNDDPADFLSNLDLFLLSSRSEGFSISTIQAMAAGLPVIVTRSGGPQEIVRHKESGWLIDTAAPQQIANAVIRLVDDPALRQRLAIAGQNHAIKTFDIKNMIRSYEEIYSAVM